MVKEDLYSRYGKEVVSRRFTVRRQKMKQTEALTQKPVRRTRARAIRAKCIDCCCDNRAEVRACTSKRCPLWIYRMGYETDLNDQRVKQKE